MKKTTCVLLILAVLAAFGAFACGDEGSSGSTGPNDNTSCEKDSDCAVGQYCSNDVCLTSDLQGNGDECTSNTDCYKGQFCASNNQCADIPTSNTPGDTDNVVGDNPTQVCTPDDYRCNPVDNGQIQQCSELDGVYDWHYYKDCGDGESCINGVCRGENDCGPEEAGNTKCVESQVFQCSSELLFWGYLKDCLPPYVCYEETTGNAKCKLAGDACEVCDENNLPLGCGCTGENQYCMPDAVGSTTGACATYCDRSDGTACPRGWECVQGQCQPVDGYCTSDSNCSTKEFCNYFPNADDGQCEKRCYESGVYCPANYRCVGEEDPLNAGRCILKDPNCVPCSGDTSCEQSHYCEISPGMSEGCCIERCQTDDDCPGILKCVGEGKCRPSEGGDCNGGCPEGYICATDFDQCFLNCPACPADRPCCDAASAPICYDCGECVNPAMCGFGLPQCCPGSNCSVLDFAYGVVGFCQ